MSGGSKIVDFRRERADHDVGYVDNRYGAEDVLDDDAYEDDLSELVRRKKVA